MCGITGLVGPGIGARANGTIEAMVATLAQRGPDAQAWSSFADCVLGHTRLSILDLVTGGQPMHDNTRKLAISFNGEIYNFQELRQNLEARGHRFSTHSDTEVILKAFSEFGERCAEQLDGMFAFAIWDDDQQRLFLARDRFGKKPLYYAYDADGTLLFGSEIKALIASGRVQPEIDHEAVDLYLRLLYVPPDRTIYKNIFVLPPGHAGVYERGRMTIRRYWDITYSPIRIGYQDAKEEVRRLLHDAVRKRMVADVEIGALLSGGVDSTIVTQLAQECTSRPVKTFSVGYGDYINELPYSQAASERIGTDHYVLQVGGRELADELVRVATYFDEPHADSSNVAQCLVSQLARTKVKVALCGDGGDEVFLGYPWYWRHLGLGRRERLKQALLSSPVRDYLRYLQPFRAEHRAQLWIDRVPRAADLFHNPLRGLAGRGIPGINLFDLTVYLPGQLLTKADRAGMMTSLEVRSPLLDHTLAQFVFNLPTEFKTDGQRGKIILKDLLREVMPSEFVDRTKQGFGAPVAQWLKGICRELVFDLFVNRAAGVYDWFERTYVRGLIDRFYHTPDQSDYWRLWSLLCLELWHGAHVRHAMTGAQLGSPTAALPAHTV